MRIPVELLETLVTALDAGTLDAAARRLHLTPSAVSQRIKALEEHVGRVLLIRTRPVQPTDAARPLLRYARQLDLLEREALADGGSGEIVEMPLAVNADSLATWFLEPLARLTARHPLVFDLHRDDQDFTAGLLESGAVMAAVTSRAEPVAGCRVTPLGTMRYEAVATREFAARWMPEGPGVAALNDAPVVDFDRRDDLQTRWLVQMGADAAAPPRHRIPASADFATAVSLGLGWALLPQAQSHAGLASGALVALGGLPVDVPLHWQQWRLRSPMLDAVADEIIASGRAALRSP